MGSLANILDPEVIVAPGGVIHQGPDWRSRTWKDSVHEGYASQALDPLQDTPILIGSLEERRRLSVPLIIFLPRWKWHISSVGASRDNTPQGGCSKGTAYDRRSFDSIPEGQLVVSVPGVYEPSRFVRPRPWLKCLVLASSAAPSPFAARALPAIAFAVRVAVRFPSSACGRMGTGVYITDAVRSRLRCCGCRYRGDRRH